MIKYCPNCGFEEENFEFDYCPKCNGSLMVRQEKGDNTQNIGSDNSRQQASKVDIGTGAAVKGNVTSNTITNDNSTSNVVNNVTNIIKEKSPAEIHEENVRVFSRRCRALCNDGLITNENQRDLEVLRSELGIEQEEAHAILSEAKRLSKKLRTELTIEGRLRLEKTLNIINGNRQEALISELNGLRKWKQEYNVEELDQLYYQLYALLTPNPYVSELDNTDDVTYWQSYWSVVAYQLLGIPSKAEVAHLNAWDSLYPVQNKLLLQSVIALMQCDESTARENFNAVHAGISDGLKPVARAVKELLDMDWDRELATLPAASQFYYETLFKDYCAMCLRHAEERRQERIATQKQQKEELERKREEQIRRQQDIEAVNAEAERVEKQRQLEEERRKKAEAEAEKAKAKAEADKQERERLEAERIARLEEKRRQRAEWWRRNWKWFLIVVILGIAAIVAYKKIESWKEKQEIIRQEEIKRQNDFIAAKENQDKFDKKLVEFNGLMEKELTYENAHQVISDSHSVLLKILGMLDGDLKLKAAPRINYINQYNNRIDEAIRVINDAIDDPRNLNRDSMEQEMKPVKQSIEQLRYEL